MAGIVLRRGLFFPGDNKRPRFEWVKNKQLNDGGDIYEHFNFEFYFKAGLTLRLATTTPSKRVT